MEFDRGLTVSLRLQDTPRRSVIRLGVAYHTRPWELTVKSMQSLRNGSLRWGKYVGEAQTVSADSGSTRIVSKRESPQSTGGAYLQRPPSILTIISSRCNMVPYRHFIHIFRRTTSWKGLVMAARSWLGWAGVVTLLGVMGCGEPAPPPAVEMPKEISQQYTTPPAGGTTKRPPGGSSPSPTGGSSSPSPTGEAPK